MKAPQRARRPRRGIPLRTIVPNAVTALALCSGLFGIRFAIGGEWDKAVGAVVLAAILDGLDGRIARLLNGQSRFGAELDSLSDVTAFGVAPAIILYLWVIEPLAGLGADLDRWNRYGWLFLLAYAVCAALRLARFNANIDAVEQPHKSAGFLTGVPAPAGAGLVLLPVYLWSWTEEPLFREPWLAAPWAAVVGFLMISNLATFSWGSLRLRSHVRLGALVVIALVFAALISAPFPTLSVAALLYALMIPVSIVSYSRVKRQRGSDPTRPEPPEAAA
ncbi:MAG TPA: phosphatidylcholine/phosphatidylserine synthase [Allosphingosinicella sp.]|nr:phosphatidylcholine/phosphatidylserine synthase [Allosphingosinicella sp.]